MDLLDRAIEMTREYGRRFGVEYGPKQIKERLISNRVFTDKQIDDKTKKLVIKNSQLKNDDKIKKAKELAELIGRYFNDILMIGITGSVAAGYPKPDDDIDLMVVTKNDRLWITRLLLRIFIYMNKVPHRKYGKKESGNEFCFNLWLEEDVLKLPKDRQTLRNAMDSILMIPILNKQNTYDRFMKENSWIKKFVATAYAKTY